MCEVIWSRLTTCTLQFDQAHCCIDLEISNSSKSQEISSGSEIGFLLELGTWSESVVEGILTGNVFSTYQIEIVRRLAADVFIADMVLGNVSNCLGKHGQASHIIVPETDDALHSRPRDSAWIHYYLTTSSSKAKSQARRSRQEHLVEVAGYYSAVGPKSQYLSFRRGLGLAGLGFADPN